MDAKRRRRDQPPIEPGLGDDSFAVKDSSPGGDKPPGLFDRCHGVSPLGSVPPVSAPDRAGHMVSALLVSSLVSCPLWFLIVFGFLLSFVSSNFSFSLFFLWLRFI
jgi:hypothetical protein